MYAKALEILWRNQEEFNSVVLRMGSFHFSCVFLTIIGKRFAGSGLRDLLVESGVLAEGSVDGVLPGKHYNRGVRAHKLVMEALCRLQMEQFCTWCSNKSVQINYGQLRAQLFKLRECCDAETFSALKSCGAFVLLHDLFSDYCNSLSSEMAKFWQSYIDSPFATALYPCYPSRNLESAQS